MIRVMFVCLGNICRSPMAEFMFTDMVKRAGAQNNYVIASAGTSREEEGNSVHRGTVNKLRQVGVPIWPRYATALTAYDYDKYDYFLAMDEGNVRRMQRLFNGDKENKVFKLLDFTAHPRDIADPWYTGNFDDTYCDIKEGVEGFLKQKTVNSD